MDLTPPRNSLCFVPSHRRNPSPFGNRPFQICHAERNREERVAILTMESKHPYLTTTFPRNLLPWKMQDPPPRAFVLTESSQLWDSNGRGQRVPGRSLKQRITRSATLSLCALIFSAVSLTAAQSTPPDTQNQSEPPVSATAPAIVIESDFRLPETYPRASYEFRFHAHGGIPPLHWRLEKGALPPGVTLQDDGLLHGQPERAGEFQFTISVTDASAPPQAVQKQFVLLVRSALTVNWKTPAHVTGNRIDGTVNVSNATPDDMDLTFVVMAVAGNGRATAIGYQRFTLNRGTMDMELPFGEPLPHGAYVVHVDVVGEVASKNVIYRERMQSPSPLQVTVGP